MRKIYQLLALSSLLSFVHAEIPFVAIKNLYKIREKIDDEKGTPIFQAGYDHLCPIWGFLALKSGLISNLRFYGPQAITYRKNSVVREFSKDLGSDGMMKLIKILFPSTGGDLCTTANYSGNLGKYMTPESVAYLIDYVQKMRKESKTQFNEKIFKDTLKTPYQEKDVLKKLQEDSNNNNNNKIDVSLIFQNLIKSCLDDETNKAYPLHTTEHMLLAFLWLHFNEKKDIGAYYNALGASYINTKIDEAWNNDSLEALDHKLFINNEEKITAKGDFEQQTQLGYGVDYFSNPTPYVGGTNLISNGDTRMYDGKQEIKKTKPFPDCVEVSLRHLFNFVLYDKKNDSFNVRGFIEKIETHLESLHTKRNLEPNPRKLNRTSFMKNLVDFYDKHQPSKNKANNGTIDVRSAWNRVVAAIDDTPKEKKKFRNIYYNREQNNELHPGFINRINVIEGIIGCPLEEFAQENDKKEILESMKYLESHANDQDESYNNHYKTYVTKKFEIFLNLAKSNGYEFYIKDFKIGQNNGLPNGHPWDRFDSTMKIKGEYNGRSFVFKMMANSGHGQTFFPEDKHNKLIIQIADQENPLLQTLSTNKKFKDPTYALYAKSLIQDNDTKHLFLQEFYETHMENQQQLFPVLKYIISTMGLEDPQTVQKVDLTVKAIMEKYKLTFLPNTRVAIEFFGSLEDMREVLPENSILNYKDYDQNRKECFKKNYDAIDSFFLEGVPNQKQSIKDLPKSLKELAFTDVTIDFKEKNTTLKKLYLGSQAYCNNLETSTIEELSLDDDLIQEGLIFKNLKHLIVGERKNNFIGNVDLSALSAQHLSLYRYRGNEVKCPTKLKTLDLHGSSFSYSSPNFPEDGLDLLMLDKIRNFDNFFTTDLGKKHPHGYSIKHLEIKRASGTNPLLNLIHLKDLETVTIDDTIKTIHCTQAQAQAHVMLKKGENEYPLQQVGQIKQKFGVDVEIKNPS